MGAVDTTYTFTATDTITSTKMNNIIDQTTITGDAIFGTTLEVVSGKLKVRAQNITSNELATDSVTSTKIAAGAVTPVNLSNGGPQWTTTFGSIPNFSISGDYNFYQTTERSSDGYSAFHFGSQSGSHINATIKRNSGVDGHFDIENFGTGQLRLISGNGQTTIFSQNGLTLYKDASNAANIPVPAGTAPIYGARAWGILDGDSFTTVTATSAVRVGTLVTITATAHGFSTGDVVPIYFSSNIASGEYVATKVSDNVFTVTTSASSNVSSATTQWHPMTVMNGQNIKSFLAMPNGAGRYTVNFNIPMASANYSVIGLPQSAVGNPRILTLSGARTANGFGFFCESNGGSALNVAEINISVFA